MKIIVFIVTALIQLAVGVVGFFMLLLGLNGFSERDATPSLIFYIVLVVASALGLGGASALVAKRLVEKHRLGRFWASLIVLVGSAMLGVAIVFGGFFVAALLASFIHDWKR